MKKLLLSAALIAALSAPLSVSAAQSASLNEGKITLECANGESIQTFENDPTIWIFAQKWECRYHEPRTLLSIFRDGLDAFIR